MVAYKPSDAELANLVDCMSLATWAGFSATVPTAIPPGSTITDRAHLKSPLQLFLGFCGSEPTSHYRTLASVPTLVWEQRITALSINGVQASMNDLGAAACFHQMARCICRLEPWPDAGAAAAIAQAAAVAPPPVIQQQNGARLLNTPTIKLDQVLDQKLSDEITYLQDAEIVKYHHNYYVAMEEEPPPNVAVTKEQLTASDYVIKAWKAPYADFGVLLFA